MTATGPGKSNSTRS